MKEKNEITVKLKLSAKHISAAIVLALMIWRPALLESAQSMTMTSYYPAPYGGYNQLLTTGNTYLGDTSGAMVYLARNGGTSSHVCVGSSAVGMGSCPASSGSGVKANFDVYGNVEIGFPLSGQDSDVPSGTFSNFGQANLAVITGKVKIGEFATGMVGGNGNHGVFSEVPFSTNRWVYVGSNGSTYQYRTPNQRSGATNNENMGVLVDASANAGGVGVVHGAGTAIMTTTSSQARIGGAQNTSLNIVAGNNSAITMTTAAPPVITVVGKTIFNNDIELGTLSNGYQTGTLRKIKGLCYQKIYGRTATSSCDSGYAAVGFLPNDGLSGMIANGRHYVGSIGTESTRTSESGDQSTIVMTDKGYSNPHVLAGGWLTCCAMEVPTK